MQRLHVSFVFLSLCSTLSLRLMVVCANGQPQRLALDKGWFSGTATWYGEPEGSGSTGACGYGAMVNVRPFKARVSAGGPTLFKKGKGCGACYKVKCLDKSICAKRAVTVIITDECPGCSSDHAHFDLSGAAFGRMAVKSKNNHLRNKGRLPIIYKRTPCKYPGKKISFDVNEGSSPYWLSLLVKFVKGDGEIGSMQIQQAGSKDWMLMTHLWGANWALTRGPLKGPFSVKVTTSMGKNIIAKNAIPSKFSPKATYTSHISS